MVIAFKASGGMNNKTAGTSFAAAATASLTIANGDTVFVWVTFDNSTATTPTITAWNRTGGTDIIPTGLYAKLLESNSPQSASGGGVRGELWRFDYNTGSGTGSFTATLSVSTTAKAASWAHFSGVGTMASGNAASGGTISCGAASLGQLYLEGSCTETNAAPTKTSGVTTTKINNFTTGGNAQTNVGASLGYSIISGIQLNASQTWSVTDGGVFAAVFNAAGPTDTQKIAIGSTVVGLDKLYIGTTKINRVYIGTTMVFDDADGSSVTEHSIFGSGQPYSEFPGIYSTYADLSDGWTASAFHATGTAPAETWEIVGARLWVPPSESNVAGQLGQAGWYISPTNAPINTTDNDLATMLTALDTNKTIPQTMVSGWNQVYFPSPIPIVWARGFAIGWWIGNGSPYVAASGTTIGGSSKSSLDGSPFVLAENLVDVRRGFYGNSINNGWSFNGAHYGSDVILRKTS